MAGSMRTFVTDRQRDGAGFIGPAGWLGGSKKHPVYVTEQAKKGNAVTRAHTHVCVREKIMRHTHVLVPIVFRVSRWHAVRDNGVP